MPLGFLTESERRVDPRGTHIFSIKSLSVLLFEQVSRADNLKLGQATAQLTKCNCIIFWYLDTVFKIIPMVINTILKT